MRPQSDRIGTKACELAASAGHRNLPYSMGIRLALENAESPEACRKINPEFYSVEFWAEMIAGYDFAKKITAAMG